MTKLISVVVPAYNESESLPILNENIVKVMKKAQLRYEIIYVDDGSADNTAEVIKEIAIKDKNIKGVLLRKNFGQSAATAAGIDQASGDIVVMMDADLQNDPEDIPKLIDVIDHGADIVSGWRKDRKDNPILRNIPSWLANKLVQRISGLRIHDLGCSLKAYRREIIKEVKLYGETHRFIAIYANMIGGKVEEVVVNHHPRKYGNSNYGLNRVIKVLLDLITLKYMMSYSTRPIYFFGKLSIFIAFLGLCTFIGLILHKTVFGTSFVRSPFMLLTAMIIFVSFQVLITGILAEILMRVYHESQEKPVYYIKKIVNGKKDQKDEPETPAHPDAEL